MNSTKVLSTVTSRLGSVTAVIVSVVLILGWACSGPLFGFSDTWQLVINTTTTVITFLMVFVIQNTQNRDGRAIQTKLDAIIEALEGVDDRLIGLEDEPEHFIKEAQRRVRSVTAVPDDNAGDG